MSRPRVRFGLRSLMVAVAVAAFLLFGNQIYQRWRYATNLVVYHENQAAPYESNIKAMSVGLTSLERLAVVDPAGTVKHLKGAETLRGAISLSERRAAYHRSLERKYRRAASRPWIPIPGDPPPPE